MNTRRLLLMAVLPILAFVFSSASHAQTKLPWERNTQAQDQNRSGDGRSYREPGEAYDPARHGNARQPENYGQQGSSDQQGYSGQDNKGSYDRSYDALRNDGRSRPNGQLQRPYANQQDRSYGNDRAYEAPRQYDRQPDYRAPSRDYQQGNQQGYPRRGSQQGTPRQGYPQQGYQPPASRGPGQAYAPPPSLRDRYEPHNQRPALRPEESDTFSDDEIMNAGHKFFGQVTKGLAKVIAHVFKKSGRPNAYILGEEGGGALIAGLRYGEGTLYTKAGERRRIYWQGPSIGYDFGAEGAKTMILVYNLRDINKMYGRFAGVDGSAYFVGGIGVTFQKRGRVVLAPIRSGLGLRLGANVGYLKYTRRPTWNPF